MSVKSMFGKVSEKEHIALLRFCDDDLYVFVTDVDGNIIRYTKCEDEILYNYFSEVLKK